MNGELATGLSLLFIDRVYKPVAAWVYNYDLEGQNMYYRWKLLLVACTNNNAYVLKYSYYTDIEYFKYSCALNTINGVKDHT